MAGLHFELTADNSNFIQSVNEAKASVDTATTVLQNLGKNFDISSVENKVITLNKVIRDNKEVIDRLSGQIHQWEKDAQDAFNNNQFDTLKAINQDIEEQKQKITELTNETQQYVAVLATVQESAGQQITMESVSAPKFFKSEEDFQYAQKLQEQIADLQDQIANFNGSEQELVGLRKELSETTTELLGVNTEAAQAAARLGEDLGGRAVEASTKVYLLNQAVKDQEDKLEDLRQKLNEAAEALANLESIEADPQALEEAQIQYDILAESVANAEQQMALLQGAQVDAISTWTETSTEIERHDAVIVKMLGGYDNFNKLLSYLPGPIQSVITSLTGMTGAAKAFIATPIGAIIGAFVLILQTLKTWLDSSVEGQKAFAEISGYVGGVLDQLKEIVIAVGKAIFNAFKNPKQAVIDLWNVIKTNFVNRFKAIGDMASHLGGLLKAALTLDTDGIQAEFKKLTNSFLQFGTGVENVTDKVSDFVKKTHEAASTNSKLSLEEKNIEIAESEKKVADAKRERQMAEARAKKDDHSLSKAEREAATKEYKRLNEEQTKADEAMINRKIAHQETKMSLTSNTIADENRLRDLQAQKEDVYTQAAQRERMANRMENGMNREGDSGGSGKRVGGNTGPSQEQISAEQFKANQKYIELLKSQEEERLKLERDYEYQRWQNRIDLMAEGEAKTLEQMKLDQSKELAALEEQKRSAVAAEIARQKAIFDAQEEKNSVGKKGYVKRVFNPNREDANNNLDMNLISTIEERYDAIQEDILAKQKDAEQKLADSNKASMNAYLKEFGNYQEKRLAITEEYDKKISEAQNDGERQQLIAQKNKALADLDYSEWVDSGAIAMAFGDISKLSDKTIKQLISDMELYRDKVISTFDPDKIQKYEDALSKLRQTQSSNTFGVLTDYVPKYFKDRKTTADRLNSSQENLDKLNEQRVSLDNRSFDLRNKIDEGKSKGKDVSALEKELEGVNTELKANENAIKKANNAFKQLQEEWDSLETPQAKFEAVCEGISKASKLIGDLSKDAASMADALGAEGLGEALGYLGDAMGSLDNIASGFAQGGLVGGIAAAAGEIMNWVGKIFSAGDRKHQKNIEELQDQIDRLNRSYEKLNRSIEKAFSSDASDLIDQQNEMLEKQKQLIKLQIAEEEAKKNTDKKKIQEWKDALEDLDDQIADNAQKAKEAIIGTDITSAINDFATAYAEAWESGTDAAQASMTAVKNIINSALTELLKKNLSPATTKFYDRLAEMMKKGFLTEADFKELDIYKKQMDELAEKDREMAEEVRNRYKTLQELQEELTDISFDSLSDNFKSMLLDMGSSAEDFTNSFTDMLRNALIEGLMNTKYDQLLKDWYAEFAKAMDDQKLTDSEREQLRQQYDAIVQQGLTDRDAINSIVGGGAYSQEASKGGWAAMGQDTAEELNGRFTALTELNVINNNLVAEGNAIGMNILITLQNMVALSGLSTSEENPSLLAIKDMMFLSTGYLEDIAKYSKLLISISGGIENLNDLINRRL